MRRIAKGLAWALAGVALAVAAEKPGFSQETQPLTEIPEFSGDSWDLNTPPMTLFDPELMGPKRMTPGGLASKVQGIAQADPRKTEADRLLQQGIQQYRVSQFREALASWQQALDLYRDIGDRAGESTSLNNIGLTYNKLGD